MGHVQVCITGHGMTLKIVCWSFCKMLYFLPVAVVGVDIMQSMWLSGTQHMSFLEGQWNKTDAKWGEETSLIYIMVFWISICYNSNPWRMVVYTWNILWCHCIHYGQSRLSKPKSEHKFSTFWRSLGAYFRCW